MGAAENLANDADFAKLHAADPKMAEQLMVEAMKQDAAPTAGAHPGYIPGGQMPPRDAPLEETFTSPRNLALTAASVALPAAGAAMGARMVAGSGSALARTMAPALGGAAGSEVANLADKATQPGATLRSTLTPDLSDAAAVVPPLAGGVLAPALTHPLQALRHPIETAKQIAAPFLQPFARSSAMGKTLVNSDVQAAITTKNATAQAKWEHSRALQEQAKVRQQAEFDSQLATWKAFQEQQRAAKVEQAAHAKRFIQLQREGNVEEMARWVKDRPGVPAAHDVQQAFVAVDGLARAYEFPIHLPELATARKALVAEAAAARKTPGGEELAGILEGIAKSGQAEGLTLTNIQDSLRILNRRAASLGRATTEYASEKREATQQIITSMETALERLATQEDIPKAFREGLKAANALYLRHRTHEELGEFLTYDMLKPGPGGINQFDPVGALKALKNKSNERMVGYMQKVIPPDGEGKNLYQITDETLRQMASKGEADRLAQRTFVQGPSRPVAPPPIELPRAPAPEVPSLPYPTPHSGPLAVGGEAALRLGVGGAGYLAAGNPYAGAALAGTGALGAPRMVSALMMTKGGQDYLRVLMHHNGHQLTPTMTGFIAAGARAMQSDGEAPEAQ